MSHDISRHDRTQNSTQSIIYNFSESHLCKHTPYDLPTEMKSRKEINKQNYQRKRDSIKAKYSPAQHKATYSPAQKKLKYSPAERKLQHNATYTPAQRKLQYDATCYILSSSKETLYNPTQRKLQHKAAYSPAKRKLETSDDRNHRVPKRSQMRTSSGHIRSGRDGPTQDDGLGRLIYVYNKPKKVRLVASSCRWSGGQR